METDFVMKKIFFLILSFGFIFYSCSGNKKMTAQKDDPQTQVSDTIRIADEDLKHEIIIFEPGYGTWLLSTARPKGYYSKNFLEARNRILVTEWNRRVMEPTRYDNTLYQQQINYLFNTDYGYEINYKLYNYFIYFQQKYKQQLSNMVVRI